VLDCGSLQGGDESAGTWKIIPAELHSSSTSVAFPVAKLRPPSGPVGAASVIILPRTPWTSIS
jgi:hypothetical protein